MRRINYIAVRGLSVCLSVPYCTAFCDTGQDRTLNTKWLCLLLLPETFFVIRRSERAIASSVHGCLCDVSVVIVIIIITIIIIRLYFNFLDRFSSNPQMSIS